MNKDEIIIKTCPHVSYTDYGVWACRLYKPLDKNSFVKFGTCGANSTCPHKIAELKTQECEKYIKALEEIEVIANEGCDLPCDGARDCSKCNDKMTNFGDTCLQNAINRIIQKVKQVKN